MTEPAVPPDRRPSAAGEAYMNIVALLGRKKFGRDSSVHPEVRKTLERILDRLTALDGRSDDELVPILEAHGWLASSQTPSEEQAWALVDPLQTLWIKCADETALADELSGYRNPAPPRNMTVEQQRSWLQRSYTRRQRAGAHERARSALRARYLRRAGTVLISLVAAAWFVAVLISSDDGAITLCALAGAIGGALSGARSLRDSLEIGETRTFQTWWWVQPAVGAAVGLFVYALLSSSVITLPGTANDDSGTAAAARIVYAFLAGFSEPWVLGVLGRIGGAADKAADAAVSAPTVAPRPHAAPPPDERDTPDTLQGQP